MEAIDERLVAALREASKDLGFRLVSPFDAKSADGHPVQVEGYLPDFGGPEGIALVSFARRLRLGSLKLPMSILPKEYRKYRRKMFLKALSDFRWHGQGSQPDWLES
jgi:hypothetical protein